MSQLNPNISLSAGTGSAAPGAGNVMTSGNPLQLYSQMAQLRQANNNNELFQQQMAARQRIGQIISQAPDLATGLAQASKDPASAFAPEVLGAYRTAESTALGNQSTTTGQNRDAVKSTYQALLAGAPEPGKPLDLGASKSALQAQLASLDPAIRDRALPAINAAYNAIYSNLSSDPVQAGQQVRQRLAANAAGTGAATPDVIAGAIGGQGPNLELGDRMQPTAQGPAGTAGLTPVGPGVAKGNAPVRVDVGGAPGVPLPGVSGNGGMGVGGQGGPGTADGASPSPNPLLAGASPSSGFAANPLTISSPTGIRPMTPAQRIANEETAKDYSTTDASRTQSAAASLTQLDSVNHAIDELAKNDDGKGNFFEPGAASEARLAIGRAGNTAAKMFGASDDNLPFDPNKIAAAESLYKATRQLAFNQTNQYFGGHVANATIEEGITSVPGMENTYLGAKLIASGMKAIAQRQLDWHEFQGQYMKDPNNNMADAQSAFLKANPPEKTLAKVYSQFGMDSSGKFESRAALQNAVDKGLLPADQAEKIRQGYKAASGAVASSPASTGN